MGQVFSASKPSMYGRPLGPSLSLLDTDSWTRVRFSRFFVALFQEILDLFSLFNEIFMVKSNSASNACRELFAMKISFQIWFEFFQGRKRAGKLVSPTSNLSVLVAHFCPTSPAAWLCSIYCFLYFYISTRLIQVILLIQLKVYLMQLQSNDSDIRSYVMVFYWMNSFRIDRSARVSCCSSVFGHE